MNTFKIGSLSFHQYIGKRLHKDKIGFLPVSDYLESCTDRTTFIKAPICKNIEEFLAYAHELGHCKSKQIKESWSLFASCDATNERIYNEVNAWDWALRYVKKLNLFVSLDNLNILLNRCLGSYVQSSRDSDYTNDLVKKFNNKFGLSVALATPKKNYADKMKINPYKFIIDDKWTSSDYWGPATSPIVEKKSDKWKPWHDMQEAKARKFWRNK